MPSPRSPADTGHLPARRPTARPDHPPRAPREAAAALRRGLAAAVAASALAACIDLTGLDDLSTALGGDGRLAAIELQGPSVVAVGDTIRVGAIGTPTGVVSIFSYDRVLDAVWSTSDRSIASAEGRLPPRGDSTTTAEAVVRGLRPGAVQVRASARGATGALMVQVVAPAP